MKKYSFLFMLLALLSSCEEELLIFDNEEGQTYVKFAQSNIDLPIVFDSSADIEIPVQVSTISATPRTVTVNVINLDDEDAASADQFITEQSVTIPADSYEGLLSFTGVDAGIEIGETKIVTLEIGGIDGVANASIEPTPTTVNMFQVCPVEEDFFIGDYELTTTAPGIFGTVIFPQGVVTISQGESSPDARVFTAQVYPDLGTFDAIDFNFTLVCGTVVVASGQDTGVGCAGSTTTIGPSSSTGGFTAGDDSTITIDLADDEGGASCGAQANAQFVLTKI